MAIPRERRKKIKKAVILPEYIWDDVRNVVAYMQKYLYPGYRMGHFFEDACLNHRKYLQQKYRQGRTFPAMVDNRMPMGRPFKEYERSAEDKDVKGANDGE